MWHDSWQWTSQSAPQHVSRCLAGPWHEGHGPWLLLPWSSGPPTFCGGDNCALNRSNSATRLLTRFASPSPEGERTEAWPDFRLARLQARFFAFLGPFNRQRRLSRTAPMVPSEPPRYGVHSLRCAVTVYEESMWWWVLTISSLRSEIVIVSFVGVVPRRLPAAKEMRSVMCHECVG